MSGASSVGPSVRGSIARFMLAGLVALAALGAGGLLVLRPLGEREAVDDARSLATLAGRGVVEPALTDAALDGQPAALAMLDRVVQERVLSNDVVRVKIWTPDGRIVYSDEPQLIGRRFSLEADERDALTKGLTKAELSNVSDPENVFERDEGSLLEVYLPIRSPDGRMALFEVYRRQSAITASGRRILVAVAPVIGGALLLLWLVQVPLAWSMARRLRDGLRDRQGLLETALESSSLERRRVAADLHSGPLQDLAGLAFRLEAAAARAPAETDPATVSALRDGAELAREGTRRLRAAVVDINPGRLHDQGLAAAVADLAATLRAGGVEVEIDVPPDLPLTPQNEELLYRAAAEALRNVGAHAGAGRVRVHAAVTGGRAVLRVEDDGRGFDPTTRERRRAEGHLGLVLVEDLAAHLGGRAEVRSSPGMGTVLELEAPA
jgi:signal transduction histidine kinase